MRSVSWLLLLLCCFLARAQTPDTRDLKPISNLGAPARAVPRSYAVVIGISHYKNLPAGAQLAFPDRDAEDIYAALISPEGGQFPAENVHKLVGERATVANMRHELDEWLPSVTHDDDRVVVFFAGHGFISGGKGWLAPYDVDLHNIPGSSYAMDTLGSTFAGKVRGKWKVLLTDACHSGAITPESEPTAINNRLLDLQKSLFSLTASRDRERSFESDKWGGGHGIFTYYVVKGLQGEADTNGDGVVDADELAEYVHTNVRAATGGEQNPTGDRGSFDPHMLLAYNALRVKAAPPAPQFGNLVIEVNMDGTEVFVDGRSVGIVSKGTPLRLPGLAPGAHTVRAVHSGYEPDGPREEQIYPGQDTTLTVRILIPRRPPRAATEHFDRGVELYQKGYEANYRKAEAEFKEAVALDGRYTLAHLYLGRTQNALFEEQDALASLKQAVEFDPELMEARSSYAAVLLDNGDLDEAVRQLNTATTREPAAGTAWYLLSQAYARKGDYAQCKNAATTAIERTPRNAEAHFWLAECCRQLQQAPQAETEYRQYLALSNFDTGLAGQMNYYLAGYLFGVGRRKRAAQADIWKELHGQAYVGLCDSEWMLKRFDTAIPLCETALGYIPDDLFANYRLGVLYAERFNQNNQLPMLAAAKLHFSAVVAANRDTTEAERSRRYLKNIDSVLSRAR